MKTYLAKKDILHALEALNQKLIESGTKAEICLYGGTSMVLAFNARLSTKDVDAIFVSKEIVKNFAAKLAGELDLDEHWLNDRVKGFVSENAEFTNEGLPQFSNLLVTRPTVSYLLAMKCLAARASGYDVQGDKSDIILLMKKLQISTGEEALDIVEQYYPKERISPKTQFMILECVTELQNASPDSH